MKINVTVFRRPNMFNVNENMFHMIGYGELKNLFTIEHYKAKHNTLTLYYPERFLNILEERALLTRCREAGYKEVNITTQSVYIIQCCRKDEIGVVQDDLIEEGSQFKLSNDESGLPGDQGLCVLYG